MKSYKQMRLLVLPPLVQLNNHLVSASMTGTRLLPNYPSVVKNATETACGAPIRSRSEMYSTISTTFGVISGAVVSIHR
jgi:hypothetical protein